MNLFEDREETLTSPFYFLIFYSYLNFRNHRVSDKLIFKCKFYAIAKQDKYK